MNVYLVARYKPYKILMNCDIKLKHCIIQINKTRPDLKGQWGWGGLQSKLAYYN